MLLILAIFYIYFYSSVFIYSVFSYFSNDKFSIYKRIYQKKRSILVNPSLESKLKAKFLGFIDLHRNLWSIQTQMIDVKSKKSFIVSISGRDTICLVSAHCLQHYAKHLWKWSWTNAPNSMQFSKIITVLGNTKNISIHFPKQASKK